jgi:hypothetical protein
MFGGFPLNYHDLVQVGSLYCISADTSLLHSICGIGGLGYLLISSSPLQTNLPIFGLYIVKGDMDMGPLHYWSKLRLFSFSFSFLLPCLRDHFQFSKVASL